MASSYSPPGFRASFLGDNESTVFNSSSLLKYQRNVTAKGQLSYVHKKSGSNEGSWRFEVIFVDGFDF